MRKIISIITITILMIGAMACDFSGVEEPTGPCDITVVVVRGDVIGEFTYSTEAKRLMDAMHELSSLNPDFSFELGSGGNTDMVVGLMGIDAENFGMHGTYWALYTSVLAQASIEMGSYDYNGNVCGYSNYGAKHLYIQDGAIYVWTLENWG